MDSNHKHEFKPSVKRRTQDYVNSILENTSRLIEGKGSILVANPEDTGEYVGGILKDVSKLVGSVQISLDSESGSEPRGIKPSSQNSEDIKETSDSGSLSLSQKLESLDEGHIKDLEELKARRALLEEQFKNLCSEGLSEVDIEIGKAKYNLESGKLNEQFRACTLSYNEERSRLLKLMEAE